MGEVFYLHEDDWGMVDVIPVENMERTREVVQEGEEFGREHFDGVGWTDMFVIPEEEHPISERGIKLEELRELIDERLAEAARVTSGYGTYREDVQKGFAFGKGYGGSGAFYGWCEDGVIMGLNLVLPDSDDKSAVKLFAEVLGELGRRYKLIMANWWAHEIVDLENGAGLGKYLLKDE